MHKTVMEAEFENPLIASSGLTKPKSKREPRIRKAILSTLKISSENRITEIIINANNIAIGSVKSLCFKINN